ncbi:IS21 family transposase [Lactiplantibacillus sp. WILCCON 0030]|uniref:IS21 family transposase n=1 Tax=Lactiplantibacillus brownii TaxID=3069269 RepID=A0ABU1A7S0_9LACO|nr:IS21 family transposase [Lactiplantibacillus brownii]MDQ7936969.1 IS21 family transposase [Lactiplantibacillus brownii]
MRYDIRQGVEMYVNNNIKPNYAALARQYGVDYRTAKRAFREVQNNDTIKTSRPKRPSLLDPYRKIIQDKLELNCSAKSIYKFIEKKGFQGKYTIVREYCASIHKERIRKATIRVEYTPGLSAQVDWKENMTLYDANGTPHNFNIFLYVLPYSKLKYLTLIFERSQDTLFECLAEAFEHTGGVPNEIWFDNMKQVVDHTKSAFGKPIFNERFKQFSQDAGYKPIACRVFRPQTKGVVEALARTVERLRPYNYEFEDGVELINLIDDLCCDLNSEVSQATDQVPQEKFEAEEKEYLHELPVDLLTPFFEEDITRVVSKESMINFRKCKYSVDPRYIGKTVDIELTNDQRHLQIYYNGEPIRSHAITTYAFNYDDNDRIKILKPDLLKDHSEQDIKAYIAEHMTQYDST